MRGAANRGGKGFKIPSSVKDLGEALFNEEDYPVPTSLVPINDDWSWSVGAEPADPRDCSRYPASPYCGEVPLRWGPPLGYQIDYKRNGCEICAYIYPVIMWLLATPQVICYREPNCGKTKLRNTPPQDSPEIPEIPEGYKLQISCVRSWTQDLSVSISAVQKYSDELGGELQYLGGIYDRYSIGLGEGTGAVGYGKYRRKDRVLDEITRHQEGLSVFIPEGLSREEQKKGGAAFFKILFQATTGSYSSAKHLSADGQYYFLFPFGANAQELWADFHWKIKFKLIPLNGGKPIDVQPPRISPPPPLPLIPKENPEKEKDMCCNDCKDSKDNTVKLLREIKEVKKALGTGKLEKALDAAVGIGDSSVTAIVNLLAKRLGTSAYPMEVPESLLQGFGDELKKIESNAEFLHWLTYQFDSLVGQFPVDIEVKDIDPLKDGDQKKTIQLPNIAEAIAEIYGLTIKSSVNQEVELNMLLRLAAEIVATKNASVVTQDYARANAQFLGYKANFKPRELQYNFDFANASLDPRSKEPIVLEKLLKTVTGSKDGKWRIKKRLWVSCKS